MAEAERERGAEEEKGEGGRCAPAEVCCIGRGDLQQI